MKIERNQIVSILAGEGNKINVQLINPRYDIQEKRGAGLVGEIWEFREFKSGAVGFANVFEHENDITGFIVDLPNEKIYAEPVPTTELQDMSEIEKMAMMGAIAQDIADLSKQMDVPIEDLVNFILALAKRKLK